jgi:hypothetical protein
MGGRGKSSNGMSALTPASFDPRHLDAKSFLSPFVADDANTKTDTNAEVPLVNERRPSRNSDAWCA